MRYSLFCLLALLPVCAIAESSLSRGDVTVHYSAMASAHLSPEVARQSAVTRSAGRGLVNIAIRRADGDNPDHAIRGRVEGTARNEVGQLQVLSFREVREGDAIYYLAEPRTAEGDHLRFELVVTPENEGPLELVFEQDFFSTP